MQQQESTAAEPRGERLHHRKRRSYGDRRIEGIATLREDLVPGAGGQWMRGGDRLLGGVRRRRPRNDQYE